MPYTNCPDCGVEIHYRGKALDKAPCRQMHENIGDDCVWPYNEPDGPPETMVANIHKDKALIHDAQEAGLYVYIGRPSSMHGQWGFGNPFASQAGTKAARVVDDPMTAFRQWLLGEAHTDLMQDERRWILEQLPRLSGYTLGCFCVPHGPCHGQILKELIDTMDNDEIKSLIPDGPKEKKKIRGLTLHTPWTWLIVRPDVTDWDHRRLIYEQGEMKAIENRTWKPPDHMMGQYIAIHAGKTHDSECRPWLAESGLWVPSMPDRNEVTKGAIVGVTRLLQVYDRREDVPQAQRPWFFGNYGWHLELPVPIEPVPCRGALSLWKLESDVYDLVRKRYARSAPRARRENA